MARLKVYNVHEMRNANMPRAMMTALDCTTRGQSPYYVAAYTKSDAITRLRELGTRHSDSDLRVLDTSHGYSLFRLLAHAGDVMGYRRTADGDPIVLIPAGETEARIAARWGDDPTGDIRGKIAVPTTPDGEIEHARTTLAAERANLDQQLAAWRRDNDALQARWKDLRARDETLTDRWVESLTDEEILSDERARNELCRRAEYHSAAHKRMHALSANEHIMVSGVDARREVVGDVYHLPSTTIMLEKDSDVAAVAAAIDAWFAVWALGRPSLSVHVMEHTLSAHGAYHVAYAPGEPATLVRISYGRRQELTTGPLVDVLAYVAKNHPYRGNEDISDDDWDD